MMKERNHIIAHICLTDGTVRLRETEGGVLRRCLGGRGLGMQLLESAADEHPLIFLTGPLTDAPAPPGGRYCAVTRSADTGSPVSLSSGTCWGAVLKRAGLDGIVIEGEAPAWTYVSIENGTVRLHPAQSYAGMLSGETTRALKSVYGSNSAVLSIGPAGENLVPMAAVMCNTEHAFSRAGIGKTMGAKKLKAIAVHAENAGDIPANACERCTASCRNNHRTESDFAALCNEYGLDCLAAAQVIAAIGAIENAPAAHWIREISCPKTPLAKRAGYGLAALQQAYGAPVPPVQKTARERVKQKLTPEMTAVVDSLGGCLFSASAFAPEDYAKMLAEATGEVFSPEELLQSGAEILQLERRIAQHQVGSAR